MYWITEEDIFLAVRREGYIKKPSDHRIKKYKKISACKQILVASCQKRLSCAPLHTGTFKYRYKEGLGERGKSNQRTTFGLRTFTDKVSLFNLSNF